MLFIFESSFITNDISLQVRSLGNKIEGLEKKTQELAFCVTKAEELNNGYVEQLRQKSQELGKAQQNICELIDAKAELEE